MATDIISNGNKVLKEIKLDFQNYKWSLKVRGKGINLEKLGISGHFDGTKECLDHILHMTNKLNICVGLPVGNKQQIPIHITTESITMEGDENSHEFRMRSKSCKEILSWFSTGKSCRPCTKHLNSFKNDKSTDDQVINLDNCGDSDLQIIFEQIFPDAPANMTDFLLTQHKILSAPLKHEKRVWEKSVIKTCLNLWSRSAKSYEDLVDSKIFQLPSGRNLRRYKNAVAQEPGISDEIFQWMRNTAEKLDLHEAGYYGA
jgi:hypothetical protein